MPLLRDEAAALRYVIETAEFAADNIAAVNVGKDSAAGQARESEGRLRALPDYLRSAFRDLLAYEAEATVCRELGFGEEASLSPHSAYGSFLLTVTVPDWPAAMAVKDRLPLVLCHRSQRYGSSVAPDEAWPDVAKFGERGQAVYSYIRIQHFSGQQRLQIAGFAKLADGRFVEVHIRPESHPIRIVARAKPCRGHTEYEDAHLVDEGGLLRPWPMVATGWAERTSIPDFYRF